MTAPDFEIKKGDLLPAYTYTCLDENGNAVDLTGATSPKFYMRKRGDTALKVSATATVGAGTGGLITYSWTGTDTDTPGHYDAEFEVQIGGKRRSFPHDRNLLIQVLDDVE